MTEKVYKISERIKYLRDGFGLTQAELARILGLSRSAINAWEVGIAIPSTQCIIQLAKTFNVSADYLLGINGTSTVSTKGLTDKQVSAIVDIIECYKNPK